MPKLKKATLRRQRMRQPYEGPKVRNTCTKCEVALKWRDVKRGCYIVHVYPQGIVETVKSWLSPRNWLPSRTGGREGLQLSRSNEGSGREADNVLSGPGEFFISSSMLSLVSCYVCSCLVSVRGAEVNPVAEPDTMPSEEQVFINIKTKLFTVHNYCPREVGFFVGCCS